LSLLADQLRKVKSTALVSSPPLAPGGLGTNALATVDLDAFTLANILNNSPSTSINDTYGSYTVARRFRLITNFYVEPRRASGARRSNINDAAARHHVLMSQRSFFDKALPKKVTLIAAYAVQGT
jgi:hypothetical protein